MDGAALGRVLGEDTGTRKAGYLAVLTLEELPKKTLDSQETLILIVNTEPTQTSGEGEHWVAIYGDQHSPYMEYFDPFGLPPFRDGFIRFFHHQRRPWIYNQRVLQSDLSSTCGYYCLYYLLLRCRGYRMKDITMPFTENRNLNDTVVQNFIHRHFDLPVVDKFSQLKETVSKTMQLL